MKPGRQQIRFNDQKKERKGYNFFNAHIYILNFINYGHLLNN